MAEVIRAVEAAEFAEFVRVLETSAGRQPNAESIDDARSAYPLERTLAVLDDGEIVAGTASDELELTLPDGVVLPVARATLTGVLPTHRGRGLATALLTRQAHDLRRAGTPCVVATTSTPGLLAAAGYAPATRAASMRLHPGTGGLVPDTFPGRLRALPPDELATTLADVFDRHRTRRPGQVSRPPSFWHAWLQDRPLYRIGDGPRFVLGCTDRDGVVQGYLTYRLVPEDLREQPIGELVVEDLVAVTDEAHLALWRYVATFTQARSVRAPNVATDDPVRWLFTDPRRVRTTGVRDFLWLRVLDPAAALRERRYDTADRLVLDVRDPQLAENRGCYDTTGSASADPPDLRLDVASLAAAYLGTTAFTTLARAGRVTELRAGALRRADAMFHTAVAAWTVTDW